VDCLTYRWRGHSKSDRNLYRTNEEINEWKHKCPIKRFKNILVDSAVMTGEEVEALDQAAKTAIDHAAEEAQTFPEPSPENMEEEVYAL
jgi:pyruvate dehydrogenase E1 component alpha subunit